MIQDNLKSVSLLMIYEHSDVLKQKRRRSFLLQNSLYIKEQRASGVLKAVHLPYNAKGLARKSSKQYVVIGNVGGFYLGNIANRSFPEVSLIGMLGVLVPIATEYALASEFLKGNSHAAYPCKQVNEWYMAI